MSDGELDALAVFRRALQELHDLVRRPTYRRLEFHADHDGRALRISTVSDLLNGSAVPRWDTVEAFVRACAGYARARGIDVPPGRLDLDRWHTRYRALQTELANRAAERERATDHPMRAGRRGSDRPAQLPPDLPSFTGRTEQLSELDKLLHVGAASPGAGRPATVVISAIDGTAGVGKTALALHWAHRVADRFPDGQLYVDLRGFDPTGGLVEPATAVRGFLDALQVPARRLPSDADAQAALYRSLLAGKRMLIVLDNARDTAQVRPLLPGTAGSLVVVTSRNQLTSLVAGHGAHPIRLDLLTEQEARDLLAHRLGPERIAGEPGPSRKSSPGVPGCPSPSPWSPPTPRSGRTPGCTTSPSNYATAGHAGTRWPVTTRPPTCGRCSPGRTTHSARRRRPSSGCSACIRGPTSAWRPRPPWPPTVAPGHSCS